MTVTPPWRPEEAIDFVRQAGRIQIGYPLPAEHLEALKVAARQSPEKGLTVSGEAFTGSLEGLIGFEHVRDLIILLPGATSFEVLSRFTELRRLIVGETRSTRPSFEFLAHCAQLEDADLEGANRGLGAITVLRRLKTLRLTKLKAMSLEFLAQHPSISRLELLHAGVSDLEPLSTMLCLRRLWIGRLRGLKAKDLGPLRFGHLEMLAVNDAAQVESLETLKDPEISHLSLDNLRRLVTLSDLRHWPCLEVLGVRNARPTDGSLVEAAQNPNLKHLAIAGALPHEEIRSIQRVFCGHSLWYQGEYLFGTDRPPDIIAGRTDL
jgi:hypothetical protein